MVNRQGRGQTVCATHEEYPIELFRKELDINLTGMMIVMKHVALIMMKQGKGSIVNASRRRRGVAAHDHRVYQSPGRYKSPPYTASRRQSPSLTRQWAARFGEHGTYASTRSRRAACIIKRCPGREDFMKRFGAMNVLGRMR